MAEKQDAISVTIFLSIINDDVVADVDFGENGMKLSLFSAALVRLAKTMLMEESGLSDEEAADYLTELAEGNVDENLRAVIDAKYMN